MDQIGHGFAMDANHVLLEANAFVLLQYRGAALTYDAVTLTDGGRHMADFETARFTGPHLTTEILEGLGEEGSYEIGLEFAGFCLFHLLLDGIEVFQAHVLLDEGVAAHDLLQVLGIQRTIDHLVESGLHLR